MGALSKAAMKTPREGGGGPREGGGGPGESVPPLCTWLSLYLEGGEGGDLRDGQALAVVLGRIDTTCFGKLGWVKMCYFVSSRKKDLPSKKKELNCNLNKP